ncbi:MAG: hypothetical protein M3442_11975 [Chloroflexota bacterium]|nr:hypothetical protein [Chloroflexota bacterium]
MLALGVVTAAFLVPSTAAQAQSRGAGSEVLSDSDAADRVDRHGWEPRWRNWRENNRTPEDWELRRFVDESKDWGWCGEPFKAQITGNFTGTTDEIIQWAAHKWGIDADIIRAVAVKESYWNQDGEGDWNQHGRSLSHSIIQIREDVASGTYPLSRESTAFAVDYYAASLRFYHDGCAHWLGDYGSGDIWGAVGAWYSGGWWDSGAQWYVGGVQRILWERTWEQAGF